MKALESKYELPVRSADGKPAGTIEVSSESLGGEICIESIRRAVHMYGVNRRVGSACTKTRAEVAGSNRKLWRQKGTGRARVGSGKSPHWRKGGACFGPKPRDYSQRLNRLVRRKAFSSAVLAKVADGEVVVVESLEFPSPKTRRLAALLLELGIRGTCLVGIEKVDPNLYLSARNLRGVRVLPVSDWNAYEVLRHGTLLLTRKALEGLLKEEA
ncbi:MAG: 50S ribosomal protein L4 [Planctomycetes bacterium]|nr:50S ribosomal protein L4 [Planctomycetota bacterium]